jgi:Zn-dependent metalloprotease
MKHILLVAFCVFFSSFLLAQKKNNLDLENNLKTNPSVESFFMSKLRETPSMIKINSSSNLTIEGIPEFLKNALQIDDNAFQFSLADKLVSKNASEVITFAASYNGINIEHAKYKAFVKGGAVVLISMEHYLIDKRIAKVASLTNDQARNFALKHVDAEVYVWDNLSDLLSKTVDNSEVLRLENEYREYFPVGDLVYVDDYTTAEVDLKLAYKFNIYADQPVYRANVYVDAQSGKTILEDAIIKHATEINGKRAEAKKNQTVVSQNKQGYGLDLTIASGDTRYAGTKSFETTLDDRDDANPLNDRYSLDGTIDLAAYGVVDDPLTLDINEALVLNETRSLDGVGGLPIGVNGIPSYSIYDGFSRPAEAQIAVEIADNNWTSDEHYRNDYSTLVYPVDNETNNDDVALDAHWGAEIVIRYWADIHGRSSHDNKGAKIISYVHSGDAYDNAFWNGTAMTYGDGSYQGGTNPNGSFAPLTSLDVCGHEIGHGVMSATSDLVYQRESGAMNEGFSDIWAAAVENYVTTHIDSTLPYDPWGIGEQIDERDGGKKPGIVGSRALRWMDDPNAEGNPSFYGGEDWSEPECGPPTLANDQCGVHNNSGVLNKWFYLLVTGSGKTLTSGLNKITADPAKQDRGVGLPYNVEGLGFDIAEQITFKAEVLLTANAKFEEMRNVSILVAASEYTAYEVEQVTNAWFAVGVGEKYITPAPNVLVYNTSNPSLANEDTLGNGCNEINTFIVEVTAASVTTAQTAVFTFDESTATLGEDFDISPATLTFPVSATSLTQQVILTIYNDAIIEGLETIQMNFANGPELTDVRKQTISIIDDDYAPLVGSGTTELLKEDFTTSDTPEGWFVDSEFDVNDWLFNGLGTAFGRAYVVPSLASTEEPSYDGTADSSIYLISKAIDARGISNVTVSFDWEAGGENDQTALFDWGEFMYSFDGKIYESVEKFATTGSPGGLGLNDSGTFDMAMPALDGTAFTLVWRWYNDALLQGAYSFSIDNVLVTGLSTAVESDLSHSDSENVKVGNQIYYISNQDGGIIGIIENASADLGCVSLEIVETESGSNFTDIAASHSAKVIAIQADGANAATAVYDVTLYFTDEELSIFSDPNTLEIIKVNSSSIDDARDAPSKNYVISGGLLAENTAKQYRMFKGTFTGDGTFALVSQETLSNKSFNSSVFTVYPTLIYNSENVNITNSKIYIEKVAIYSITGKLVKSFEYDNSYNVTVPISGLPTGIYFIKINDDKVNTQKFIVK